MSKKKKQLNFGNFVRKELSNPDSGLSKRVKFFKSACILVKNNPQKYCISWSGGLFFLYEKLKDFHFGEYWCPRYNAPFDSRDCIADFR